MEKLASKSIRVAPLLWQKARGKALLQGQTMQSLIANLLKGYLKEAK